MDSTTETCHPLLEKLGDSLASSNFPAHLSSMLSSTDAYNDEHAYLRINATLCFPSRVNPGQIQSGRSISLGSIDLRGDRVIVMSPERTSSSTENLSINFGHEEHRQDHIEAPLTPQSEPSSDGPSSPSNKRRKTIGGLRLSKPMTTARVDDTDSDIGIPSVDREQPCDVNKPSARQFHTDTKLPQRKKPVNEAVAPKLQPSSIDKLISGIWRQLHSPIKLSIIPSYEKSLIDLRTGVSEKVFQAVNKLCVKYYDHHHSSRALEMIVQAYWVECYEARIVAICLENPSYSTTEARMAALREACNALGWQEKDLRNRMAIWRGYKEIKDSGGWASLVFAGTGVYRFCKYRIGFNEGLTTRLRHIAPSLEVAADTLHPEWRNLFLVINQEVPCRYRGHAHEWVAVTAGPAVPLSSTYTYLQLPDGFSYQFVDDCVVDEAIFGAMDPRQVQEMDPDTCQICKQRQSDDVRLNRCSCWPNLFGAVRHPPPVQIFHTASGKNNGVIARCQFDRGTAIAEFVGLVTLGVEGLDVMVGGTAERPYQIFQGKVGNFTRFINHSCRPNSQFQRFVWRGKERVIIVSRGVPAGSEITVDYSDYYWEHLNKNCLCGEPCCRFADRV